MSFAGGVPGISMIIVQLSDFSNDNKEQRLHFQFLSVLQTSKKCSVIKHISSLVLQIKPSKLHNSAMKNERFHYIFVIIHRATQYE